MLLVMHERDEIQRTRKHFEADTKAHHLNVKADDGIHRHLLVKAPDNGFGWYEVITWPGSLTINGDMGTFTFSRTHDMLSFFGAGEINPHYWMEKLGATGWNVRESMAREFTDESLIDWIEAWRDEQIREVFTDREGHLDEAAAAAFTEHVQDELLDRAGWVEGEADARRMLDGYEFTWTQPEIDWTDKDAGQGGLVGDQTVSLDSESLGESDLMQWRHHYLWCCMAICQAVGMYRAHQAELEAAAARTWRARLARVAQRITLRRSQSQTV